MSALLDGGAAQHSEEWQAATPYKAHPAAGPEPPVASPRGDYDTLTASDNKSAHQLPLNYNPFLSLEKDASNNNNLSHSPEDTHPLLDQREDTATSSGGYNVQILV